MSTILVVNAAANAVMAAGFSAFLVFLFGRRNSLIHKLGGVNTVFVKVGLALCASGSLYNLLTLSEPPPSEVVLNVGMACLFGWASWFHWVRFVRPLRGRGRRVRRKAAR